MSPVHADDLPASVRATSRLPSVGRKRRPKSTRADGGNEVATAVITTVGAPPCRHRCVACRRLFVSYGRGERHAHEAGHPTVEMVVR
jgi:hypothetical protein